MPRVLYPLFLCQTLTDLVVIIAPIPLFTFTYFSRSLADPWQNGGIEGWVSGRQQRAYSYASYDALPLMPFVGDESSTLCPLIVGAVTLFVCVVRLQINCLGEGTLDRHAKIIINAIYDALLAGLWASIAMAQSSEDLSVSNPIDLRPQYLEERRGDARVWALDGCEVSRMLYGVAAFVATWFCLRFMATCLYRAYLLGREHDVRHRSCSRDDNV